MPVFGSSPPTELNPGAAQAVWNAETPGIGTASQAALLQRAANAGNSLSVQVAFAADPGAFQVDLQTADQNSEEYYVTKASLTTGLNPTFCGRIEATNVVANYVRLKMVSRANAVAVTAKFF